MSINLAIFAKTYQRPTPEATFCAATDDELRSLHFNYACAGLPALPLKISNEIAAQIQTAASKTQVQFVGVSATYNMIHPDPKVREHGRAALATIAARCGELNMPLISLCTGTHDPDDKWRHHMENDSPESFSMVLKEFEHLLPIAEAYDVHLGIEPETANVINGPERARELLDALQSNRLKIILDPANLFEEATASEVSERIARAVDLLGPELAHVHAKDRTADGRIVPAGQGAVDFGFLVERLRAVSFAGPLVLHGLAETAVPKAVAHLLHSMNL